jgi:hypothetical protein
MSNRKQPESKPSEFEAGQIVYSALKDLEDTAQSRVLRYVAEMLGIDILQADNASRRSLREVGPEEGGERHEVKPSEKEDAVEGDEAAGINSVALRWLKRNDLSVSSLQNLFSLGLDEIDLVARSVPGESKKERMKSVFLLRGIAAYLGTGAARFSYEQLKESCIHYNGYDAANFAANLKSFSADIGGNKKVGFTLSARGLTEATALIKGMLTAEQK